MDSKSKKVVELTIEDCCCIEVWAEKELCCFKPYTRRCTAKVIPDWWNKRVLKLLKLVNSNRHFVGEVDLTKDDTFKSIFIGYSIKPV